MAERFSPTLGESPVVGSWTDRQWRSAPAYSPREAEAVVLPVFPGFSGNRVTYLFRCVSYSGGEPM